MPLNAAISLYFFQNGGSAAERDHAVNTGAADALQYEK